jgi:hypothetical protein
MHETSDGAEISVSPRIPFRLGSDTDREGLFTAAAGPIYFRMFIAGRQVDEDFIHSVVSKVCWLYCSPSAAAKLSLPARMA